MCQNLVDTNTLQAHTAVDPVAHDHQPSGGTFSSRFKGRPIPSSVPSPFAFDRSETLNSVSNHVCKSLVRKLHVTERQALGPKQER